MPDLSMLADRVLAMARRLPGGDRAVLDLWHGIDGDPYCLAEIGRIFKVTRARVRRRIDRATRRLILAVSDDGCTEANLVDLLALGLMRERRRRSDA